MDCHPPLVRGIQRSEVGKGVQPTFWDRFGWPPQTETPAAPAEDASPRTKTPTLSDPNASTAAANASVVVPHVTLATAALVVACVADNFVDAACSLNERIPPAHVRCRHAADLVAADAAALAAITSFVARLLLLRSCLPRCVPLMVLPLWLMRMAATAVQQGAGSRPPGLVPPRPGGRLVCGRQHPPRVHRRGQMEDSATEGARTHASRVVLLTTANG